MRSKIAFSIGLVALLVSCVNGATIWQEGEEPASSTMNRHPWWYDKVKPERLSGGKWISNFSDTKEGTATYRINVPEDGDYAFHLHANPVKSKLSWKLDTGDWNAVNFEGAREQINIAADDKPDLRFIAWVDAGKVKLTKGAHEITFRMFGGPQNHGGLDCFVLTTENFVPTGTGKPGTGGAGNTASAFNTSDSWPFEPPADRFTSDAMLDLRSLNENTAGETGFIKLSQDKMSFVRGDGKPIRFWGIVSDIYRKTPEEMDRHCRFLAKMGVNMVRLHTEIGNNKEGAAVTDVNEKEIDGILKFIAAAKKHGIYLTISPYWAHLKAPASWKIEGYKNESAWGVLLFNEDLQRGYKAWVKELYTRKNPYTGIALKDDPAVAIIQIFNEDSLLFWTFQGLKDPQKKILGAQFAQWLTQKYGSLDKAIAAWDGTKLKQDDPANGVVGFYLTWDMLQKSQGGRAKRMSDQTEFLSWRMRKFYGDIGDYYHKELGCKQLVNPTNWRSADAVLLDDCERWSYGANEVTALNRYTGVVHIGQNNGYRIDPGHKFISESVLKNPLTLPAAVKQPVGQPFIITETAWVHPAEYQSEAPFMMAAYQSLNGMDIAYWFAANEVQWLTDPRRLFWKVGSSYAIDKWSICTPNGIAQFPVNALAYRLGYIAPASTPAVYEERSLQNLWDRKVPIISEAEKFDPVRDRGDFAQESTIKQEVDPLAFLVGPVQVKFGGDPSKSKVVDLTKYVSREKHTVKSLTGQIELNYGVGLCSVNAPNFQGVTGFLKDAGGKFELADVSITSDNAYATIALAAMDQQPIKSSKKILVQVGTTARLGGWTTRPIKIQKNKKELDGEEIVNTGTPPWRIAATHATLIIKNPAVSKATLLNIAGYAVSQVPVQRSPAGVTIELPANALYMVLE